MEQKPRFRILAIKPEQYVAEVVEADGSTRTERVPMPTRGYYVECVRCGKAIGGRKPASLEASLHFVAIISTPGYTGSDHTACEAKS